MKNLGGWQSDYGGDLPPHVHPINDLREHIVDGSPCWCEPSDDDGIVVHHSLDGRESYETGRQVS